MHLKIFRVADVQFINVQVEIIKTTLMSQLRQDLSEIRCSMKVSQGKKKVGLGKNAIS